MQAEAQMEALLRAAQAYLDLMYDCEVQNFDRIFWKTAQLHGFRDGQLTMWPASEYKTVLANRKSPKSSGAPREEEILLIDFASKTQALVKLRVRINTAVFIDYLTFHLVDNHWIITSKAYHLV